MSRDELDWAFANIPQLSGCSADVYTITRLPGYTNRNFRLHNREQDWVLRLPRPATNRFIDRAAEAHNQQQAQRLGLAPGVAWRNAAGITLTPTLRNSRILQRSDFDNDVLVSLVVERLQRLHRGGLRFHGRQNLAGLLTRYYELLDAQRREPFAQRMAQARRILGLLDNDDVERVASHRDLVLQNLLLENDRLWLIDWEYSAMASPYWDLASLCNEAELDLDQSRRLLRAYCVGGRALQESTLFDYRGMLKLLGDCWMAAFAQPDGKVDAFHETGPGGAVE